MYKIQCIPFSILQIHNKKSQKNIQIPQQKNKKQKMHNLTQSLPLSPTNNNILNSSCLQTHSTFPTLLKESNLQVCSNGFEKKSISKVSGMSRVKGEDQNQYGEKIVYVNNISFITNRKCNNYEERKQKKVIQLNKSRSRSNNNSRAKSKKDNMENSLTQTLYIPVNPKTKQQVIIHPQIPTINSRYISEHLSIPYPQPEPIRQSHPYPQPESTRQPQPESTRQIQTQSQTISRLNMKIDILERRIADIHKQKQQVQINGQKNLLQKTDKIKELEECVQVLMNNVESKEQEISGLWKMLDQVRENKGSVGRVSSDSISEHNTTQNFINLTLSQQIQRLKYQNQKLESQLKKIRQQNNKIKEQQQTQKQKQDQISQSQTVRILESQKLNNTGNIFKTYVITQQNLQQTQQIIQINSQQLQIDDIIHRIAQINKQNQLLRNQLKLKQTNTEQNICNDKCNTNLQQIKKIVNNCANKSDMQESIRQIRSIVGGFS